VTATFAINEYAVTFDLDAKGTRTGGGALEQTITHGSAATAPNVTGNAGWVFTGWDVPFNSITGTLTVTALYDVQTYTLTYIAGPHGLISGSAQVTQTVEHGSDGVSVTAQPDTGYHFVNWSDASIDNPRQDTSVTGNITVTATFAINEYDLSYISGPGGTITGDTAQTVTHGNDGTEVVAQPDGGYHFVDWSDGFPTATRQDTSVTGDIAVTATFAINEYAVTFDLDAKGTRTGGGALEQTITHGSAATAPNVTGNAGWVFTGWDVPFNSITGTLTVTALYDVQTYTLTYIAGPHGLISGSAQVTQTVEHGSDGVSVTAQPDTGYHFVNWSDASIDNPRQDTSVTGDIAVTATFAINEYRVEFMTDGTEGASLTGDLVQTVTHGADCTAVTAVAPVDHEFRSWEGGYVGTDNPLTVTNVTADMTLTAIFGTDQVTCGSVFEIDASDIEELSVAGVFAVRPKVYATYDNPVTGKRGKASSKVLTKVSKLLTPKTIACEWTKKIRLYKKKDFRAAEIGGLGAAAWINEVNQHDLPMSLRLVSKGVEDQSVKSLVLALAAPVISDIVPGALDPKGNATLVITGRWFGTKKPKVWREYEWRGVIRHQTMKVVKPTVENSPYLDSKLKPACMDPATGVSKVIVVVPTKTPNGVLNGTIVLENGVGMASGNTPSD
jgi:hypothetical protein